MTALKSAGEDLLRQAVVDGCKSSLFTNVSLFCLADGVVVRTHRIVLAALSPVFYAVLVEEDAANQLEESTIILPDVEGRALSEFLCKVQSGSDQEEALLDDSLSHLDFTHEGMAFSSSSLWIRSDPEGTDTLSLADDDKECSVLQSISSLVGKHFNLQDNCIGICRLCWTAVAIQDGRLNLLALHLIQDHTNDNRGKLEKSCIQDRQARHDTLAEKPRVSPVWKFFTEIGRDEVMCNECNVILRRVSGSTSAMFRHLKRKHQELHMSCVKGKSDGSDPNDTNLAMRGGDSHVANESSSNDRRNDICSYFSCGADNEKSECILCGLSLMYKCPDTSSMSRHLQSDHLDVWDMLCQEPSSPSMGDRVSVECEDSIQAGSCLSKAKSIWQVSRDMGNSQAVCSLCDEVVLSSGSGLTSVLAQHLKDKHKVTDKGQCAECLNLLNESNPLWSFYDWASFIQGSSTRCLTCHVDVFLPKEAGPAADPSCHEVELVLEQHLHLTHEAELSRYEAALRDWKSRLPTSLARSRSAIWAYFDKTQEKWTNVCKTCGKAVFCKQQNTTNMIRHLKSNHQTQFSQFLADSGSTPHMVDSCLSQSVRKIAARPDAALPSSDPSSRTCAECNKLFSTKSKMRYHQRTVHSNIRPFNCLECGMTFARADSFRAHSHQKMLNFLCTYCGKTFGRRSVRDRHERVHRGDKRYPCSVCDKLFMTNQQLAKHKRTHTGEKPFQCSECGRQFAQQHQLTTHLRIHTGEKPYSCKACGQKFRHLASRNSHKC